jgi:hypothetical protein
MKRTIELPTKNSPEIKLESGQLSEKKEPLSKSMRAFSEKNSLLAAETPVPKIPRKLEHKGNELNGKVPIKLELDNTGAARPAYPKIQ